MKLQSIMKIFAIAICVPFANFAKESNTIRLFTSPDETLLWRTLESETVVLPINLKEHGADSATLTITGMRSKKVVENITTETYTCTIPQPTDDSEEDVYDLTLAYFKDGEATGAVETARLGAVRSVGEESATALCRDPESDKWGISKGKVVLQVPYGSKKLQIDEEEISLDGANSWYGWKPKAYGETYDLTLSVGDDNYLASLTALAESGLMIIYR